MLRKIFHLKNKGAQYTIITVAGVLLSLIFISIILNATVLIRLNSLKKDIANERDSLTVKIEEEVSRTLKDPIYASGGSDIESGVLVNTKELLSSDQVKEIIDEVTKSCKSYLTEDVYLGLEKIVLSDMQSEIEKIVNEKTSKSLTKEQQAVIITAVQENVMKEVNSSLNSMKEQVTSSNKTLKVLESNFTILKGRIDKLESSVNSSIEELKNKDSKIESEISQLRLSFVSSNAGTSSLQILKVQMSTVDTILTETANTINDALNTDAETKKAYLSKITSYRSQVDAIKVKVNNAIDNGDTNATDSVAKEAAVLVTEIVSFSEKVESSKTSISDLQAMIKDNSKAIADKQAQISLLKKQQTDLETSQKTLNDAQKALDDALSGKISTEDALKKINESIGSLDGFGTVAEKISAIMTSLQNADDATKQAALKDASDKVAALKTSMEEKIAKDKKALEDTQATLASKTELSEVSSDITSIIGDIGENTTISKELANVNKNLEDKAKEITDNTNSALTALQSETEADLSSLTSGQTSLQTYIDSLGTGSENDVLKEKLQAIEDARVKAVEDAKKEAEGKVTELSNNLSSEITSINDAIENANKSITKAETDLKAEILKQVGELEASTGQDLSELKTKLENDDITLQGYINSLSEEDDSLKTNLQSISTTCNAKLDASALAGEITTMLTKEGSIGTAIATELGKAKATLQDSIGKTAEDANKALKTAKEILDAEDVRIGNLIKTNADSITSINGEIDTLNTSITSINTNKANKTEVDSAISQTKTFAEDKANLAVTNAVKQAETKDEAIKSEVKTDASQKAEDAKNEAVVDAKTYTDTKVDGTIKAEYEDGTLTLHLQ